MYSWAHTTAVLNRFWIIFHPLTLKIRLPPKLTLPQAPSCHCSKTNITQPRALTPQQKQLLCNDWCNESKLKLKHFKREAILTNLGRAKWKTDCSTLPWKEEDGMQHLPPGCAAAHAPTHTTSTLEHSQPLKLDAALKAFTSDLGGFLQLSCAAPHGKSDGIWPHWLPCFQVESVSALPQLCTTGV